MAGRDLGHGLSSLSALSQPDFWEVCSGQRGHCCVRKTLHHHTVCLVFACFVHVQHIYIYVYCIYTVLLDQRSGTNVNSTIWSSMHLLDPKESLPPVKCHDRAPQPPSNYELPPSHPSPPGAHRERSRMLSHASFQILSLALQRYHAPPSYCRSSSYPWLCLCSCLCSC